MKTKELTREDFVNWGKKAGEINKKKGKAYFKRISRLGVLARKRKKISTDRLTTNQN